MSGDWIREAVKRIKAERISHRSYEQTVGDVFNALAVAQNGELVVVVGPSRVGKSRAIVEAVNAAVGRPSEFSNRRPYVLIEAENASTQGTFSTKSFMRAACEAIQHPFYGVAHESDPWRERLDAKISRTSEGMLRDAFEHALRLLKTRFVVIDEAHHVAYVARNKGNAIAVLDSWKCLANKTGVVLCLVGSYQLLDMIAQAPHLLGRQRPVEFPRYRIENREDIIAFEQILKVWSGLLRFEEGQSLRTWNRYLFEHTFGCAGHLSMWLRAALGFARSRRLEVLNEDALRATCLPACQEQEIAAEILRGEHSIQVGEQHKEASSRATHVSQVNTKPRKRKPFQRATQRFRLKGRG
ncbi:MAG: ATP-binding protein [Rudaea sp.]|uniref:ATP-binding protein n=1 Tax=unclassified Rudaea TaxID=2627037 RepID=UPI0010F6C26F|nr:MULTISPECIES: ATP-binding protein [unclassified Rudaea]MBN8886829.1 ATP-binding protein [Rudaea sp.]